MSRFHKLLKNLFPSRGTRKAPGRRPAGLRVQALEERLTPWAMHYFGGTNFGGQVLDHVAVETVYLGSQWNTDPSLISLRGKLDQYVQDLVDSPYLDQLREYSLPGHTIGRGAWLGSTVVNQTLHGGDFFWLDQNGISPTPATKAAVGGNFFSIQGTLGGVTIPAAPAGGQPCLLAFEPPNVHDMQTVAGAPVGVSMAGTVWPQHVGYHYRVGSQGTTPFILVVDPTGNGGGDEMTGMTSAASHELAEAITDPQGNSWNDGEGGFGWLDGEIADRSDHGENVTLHGRGYLLDSVFSNAGEDQGATYATTNNLAGAGNGFSGSDVLLSAPNVQWSGFTATGGSGISVTLPNGNRTWWGSSSDSPDSGQPAFLELTTDGTLYMRRMFSGNTIDLTTGGDYAAWYVVDRNVSQADVAGDNVFYLKPDGTLFQFGASMTSPLSLGGNVQSVAAADDGSNGVFALMFDGTLLKHDGGGWHGFDQNVQAMAAIEQGGGWTEGLVVQHQDGTLYSQTWGGQRWNLDSNVQSFAVAGGTIHFLRHDRAERDMEFQGNAANTYNLHEQALVGFNDGGVHDVVFGLGQNGNLGILDASNWDAIGYPYADSNVRSVVVGNGGQWDYDLHADGTLYVNYGDGWKVLDTQIQSIAPAGGLGVYALKNDGTGSLRYINPTLVTAGADGTVAARWATVDTGVQAFADGDRYGTELYKLKGGVLSVDGTAGWQTIDTQVQSFQLAYGGERVYWAKSSGLLQYRDASGTYTVHAGSGSNGVTAFIVASDGYTVHYLTGDGFLRQQDTRSPWTEYVEDYAVTSIALDPLDSTSVRAQRSGGNPTDTFDLMVTRQPEAVNWSYSTHRNQTLTVAAPGLQTFDRDPDRHPMTTVLVSGPAHGTLTYAGGVHADGSFQYVPAPGYVGGDSFTYRETDVNGGSNIATVTLTVNPPAAISAPSLTYRVVANQALTTTAATGLLANFTDPNGQTPSIVLGTTHTAHGSLGLNTATGLFTYTPNAGFRGTDTFTYQITDGAVTSPSATVTLLVGQAPVAANFSYSMRAGTIFGGPSLVSINGDTGGTAHLSGPTPTGLTLNSDGSFGFADIGGTVSRTVTFQYYVTNPDGTSGTGTITINISAGL